MTRTTAGGSRIRMWCAPSMMNWTIQRQATIGIGLNVNLNRREDVQLVSGTHGFKFEAPNKIIDVVLQFVSETHGLKSGGAL